MDFNPLDILATAALGDKGSSSETAKASGGSTSDQETNTESTECKDPEDDSYEDMGKTKHNCLRSPLPSKPAPEADDMALQKLSWSPDVFVSCLDKPLVDPKKLIIEELSKDVVKSAQKYLDKVKLEEKCNSHIEESVDSSVNSKQVDISDSNSFSKEDDPLSITEKESKGKDSSDHGGTDLGENSMECDGSPQNELPSRGQDHLTENGGQSDTDTADTTDSKLAEEISDITCQDLISMDHPYCLIPGQLRRLPSMENTDDDIDVCSDNSPFSEDGDQRSRNFSLDCNYLKSNFMEAVSTGPPDIYDKCSLSKPLKEEGMNNSSSLSAFKQVGISSPDKRCAKFKIGTYASFSSSNLELEKYLRNKDTHVGKKLDIGIPSDSSFTATSTNSPIYTSVHTLLQSPSLDWDRSETGSETPDDSSDARTPHRLSPDLTMDRSTEWSHPMYHDHDYCNRISQPKVIVEEIVHLPLKRKYTKKKTKLDINHEKIMKAKYLKKELLKQEPVLKSTLCPLLETPLSIPEPASLKANNPVGRPRKRPYEKPTEEEIDPETGAKMKITGKFQDQYVYYLSKSSRTTSRRRQTPTLPFPADKILVPAPKPGDIIVPHLTDADIEIVRQRGRGALNIPERPHMPNIPSIPVSCPAPTSPLSSINHSNELISDVDSHIVSTILSMESDNLVSPSSSQSPELSHTPDLYNSPSVSDQYLNYLLSGVKDDDHSDALLQSSASLFPALPSDPQYSKVNQVGEPYMNKQGQNDGHLHQKFETQTFGSRFLLDQCPSDSDILPTGSAYCDNTSKADSVNIPDLSSFISNSQVTTASSSTQDGDSQGSAKSVFSPDLSSLDTPQLSNSVPRLTSIEKTLDFLGVKDGEIKLENDDLFGSKMSQEVISSPLSTTSDSINDDTPWIVTVTLYFNDVPATMINSTPYIRLVDIHKQILPAKDTGILKKRCQLLNIPVSNCTEMQRYFLVQYGRAYNSKSTLIVSKEQANTLVTYYATPQPRIGRTDEAHVRRLSHSVSSDGSNLSPVDTSSTSVKKRSNHRSRKSLQQNGLAYDSVGSPGSRQTQSPVTITKTVSNDHAGLNKRTRHKKVNYLEMLKGEEKEEKKSTEDSIRETIEAVIRASPDFVEDYCVSDAVSKKQSHSKKKLTKTGDSLGNKKKNERRKSSDSKKKSKGNEKVKAKKDKLGNKIINKTKGSTLKLVKKGKKKLTTEDRNEGFISNQELELELANKLKSVNNNNNKPSLKLKVNSLLNFSPQKKQVTSATKKGLFARSNSSSSTPEAERQVRVLAVAHQPAISSEDTESHLPSQPADIHLDLFTKSNSACVCCHTCSQFLSVPHFMRHHHVPMNSEWLASESAHRILVPRNKENISDIERKLWEEFHYLQEAIGGFGEGDDDSDDDDDSDEAEDDESNDESIADMDESLNRSDSFNISSSENNSSISSCKNTSTSPNNSLPMETASLVVQHHQNIVRNGCSDGHNMTSSSPSQQHSLSNKVGTSSFSTQVATGTLSGSLIDSGDHNDSALHVRTSSRKRKSKQFFSIENYYTSPKKIVDDGICQSSASG